MTPCTWPGCDGTVDATGFCGTCYRRPLAPEEAASAATTARSARSGDPASLPAFDFPDPTSRVLSDPRVPQRARRCPNPGCRADLPPAPGGGPALSEGFCGKCRARFSFLPSLVEDEVVAGQYRVAGCFAHGGLGWIYLARDTHLDDNPVVLKGLIDSGDESLAVAERRALTAIGHQNIVRIFNFVTHPDPRTGAPRPYIVMEYVEGVVLSEVAQRSKRGELPLGEPLRAEHVAICGLQVLSAFAYLHERGLLYCDMKPDNLILRPGGRGEAENRVKVIDLGAVRRVDDRGSPYVYTPEFQVGKAEIEERGLTADGDLYTLGKTLEHLLNASADRTGLHSSREERARIGVGLESLDRVCLRAAHPDPGRRFASAAEMAEQLRGALREVASLRDGRARPAPSAVFAPTAVLLDAGLGAVPPLARWTGRPLGDEETALDPGLPGPAAVAVGLPVPRVDPDDPAAGFLAAADAPDARRLLDKLDTSGHDTPEVAFARCRARLELGEVADAHRSVERARALLGREAAGRDWRLAWHEGLLALADREVGAAEARFDAVYDALPGEDAPKSALAFCAERAGRPKRAEELYGAVWRRDRAQGSAAFGLARLRLARGDRAAAVAVLDEVPRVSRHYDAAAIAAVVVLCGLIHGARPSPDDLAAASARLPGLYLDGGAPDGESRERLVAVVREAALGRLGAEPHEGLRGGVAFGERPTGADLRALLEQSYRALARQARDPGVHAAMVDRANTIRPMTFL